MLNREFALKTHSMLWDRSIEWFSSTALACGHELRQITEHYSLWAGIYSLRIAVCLILIYFFILFSDWKCRLTIKWGTFLYQRCLIVQGQMWFRSPWLTLYLYCTVNDFNLTFSEYGLNSSFFFFLPTATFYIFCSPQNLATYSERNKNCVTHVI